MRRTKTEPTTSYMHYKYPLGVEAEDKFTGVKGFITMVSQRINGAIVYAVQPKSKEDAAYRHEAINVDEASIVLVKPEEVEKNKEFAQAMKFETGDRVRHRVNGFEGIVTSRALHANGCIFYAVEGKLNKEGKAVDHGAWEIELELIDKGLNDVAKGEKPIERKRTGGPDRNYPMPD